MTLTMTDSHATQSEVALVTGGGQGIGAAISHQLAADGFHVIVNDIAEERAGAVSASIKGHGGMATPAVADVSRSDMVNDMFDRVEASVGQVTALVNNAGVGGNAAVRNVTDDDWRRVMSIDLDSAFFSSRRALDSMRDRRVGAIVNIASRAWLGWWGQSTYASAKAGMVGLTRALAVEMSSRSIRVNAVAPGLIDTPLLRNRSEEALERLKTSVPVGTIGQPQDVANAVSFLLSDRARTITGQVLYVGGGKSVYAYPDWQDNP
jgi:NAD(P)-dependent dehydrogenase (short-subunit alcohol dehydrogenase family)